MKLAKKGFTLIELLVVVAIIAVLIAILLPSLGRAKEKAKTVKCQAIEHAFFEGMNVYQTEFDGFVMPCSVGSPGKYGAVWYGPLVLGYELSKTDSKVQLTLQGTGDGGANVFDDQFQKTFRCPSFIAPPYDAFNDPNWTNMDHGSYTYNMNLGFAKGKPAVVSYNNVKNPPRTTLALLETHMGADKGDYDWRFSCLAANAPNSSNSGSTSNLLITPNPLSPVMGTSLGDGYGLNPNAPLAGLPHNYNTQANMLFVDGSIITDTPQKMSPGGNSANYEYIVQASLWSKVTAAFPFK